VSQLSIITVAYQSAEKLPGFLASARSAAPCAESIVVDNASTDETVAVARRHDADRVISSSANLGFGRACNLGAGSARGDWLLFANPDLAIESVPPLPLLGERPFGIAGGWLSEKGHASCPSLRAEPTFAEEAATQLFYRLIPRGHDRLAPRRRRPSRWASGALLLCRRDEFLGLGGFDPRFFLYFEDRDLARRYRRAGHPLRLEERLRGHHGHGASSPGVRSWVREAWSLVSWIEYRGVWRGPAAARHAARLTLSGLSSIRVLGERIPGDRTTRKAEEVAQILAFLQDLDRQLAGSENFHPFARAALREALSPEPLS
jgi:N-acetylglucosaminyl-diphospho-decaprenol L-rhamnosyltransferase